MAIVATLTPTPVPASTLNGEVLGTAINHVTITSAGGAGTYNFPHNLQWKPLMCIVVPQLAEGTTPSAANSAVAYCIADTTTTNLAVNLPGNGTFDVYFI
jgi:hypothetical protein